MKYEPKRYTTMMGLITNPRSGLDDIGDAFARGASIDSRAEQLDVILKSNGLTPDSSEKDVRNALGTLTGCTKSDEHAYRNSAIIQLVYDIMPC